MEISGFIFRQISVGVDAHSCASVFKPSFLGDSIDAGVRFSGEIGHLGRRNLGVCVKPRNRYSDEGHLKYYSPAIKCGGGLKEKEKEMCNKEKKMKKRLKLLKGLGKDISLFEDMAFGLDPPHALADQVKGKMISEAADVLLGQLQQLKTEKKEMKKQRKKEKARLKAARMQNKLECKGSSSSSSESSDIECGEVVVMSRLKAESLSRTLQIESQPVITHAPPQAIVVEERDLGVRNSSQTSSVEICSLRCTTVNKVDSLGFNEVKGVVTGESSRKIEVCMGGKCKKSGAALLLDEFQKAVGGDGAVIGCKCMGKCRSAPNVKVLNSIDGLRDEVENDSVRTPANPLCTGVGLEDVETIVANFFGGNHKDLDFAAAS